MKTADAHDARRPGGTRCERWDARRAGRERHRPAARAHGTTSGEEVVELAALHALDQGVDLGAGVHEGRTLGEARVADGDGAVAAELGELDAIAGGAEAALAPGDACQLARRDSAVHARTPDLRG